jgi:hypothetical protein
MAASVAEAGLLLKLFGGLDIADVDRVNKSKMK